MLYAIIFEPDRSQSNNCQTNYFDEHQVLHPGKLGKVARALRAHYLLDTLVSKPLCCCGFFFVFVRSP